MADDITNQVLLDHMQSMKFELQQEMRGMKFELQHEIRDVQKNLKNLEERVERGFEEARLHREALQEDLEATMRMQAKHQRKLEKLSV